jgi:hypothetical protein
LLLDNSSGTEQATRPVVQIIPRNGRPLLFAGSTITATVIHDYELNFGTAAWQVIGGATVLAGAPTTTTQPPSPIPAGSTGPWTTTWTTSLPGLIPPTGAVTVQFICQEMPYAPPGATYRPPIGISVLSGINEVRF